MEFVSYHFLSLEFRGGFLVLELPCALDTKPREKPISNYVKLKQDSISVTYRPTSYPSIHYSNFDV
jgi:hypothetical protein